MCRKTTDPASSNLQAKIVCIQANTLGDGWFIHEKIDVFESAGHTYLAM